MRLAVAGLVVLALAGCGTADDREQAAHAAERFYTAVGHHDGTAACAELSADTAKTIFPCRRAVTGLDLHGGRVLRTRVYITNAIVELAGGDVVFLGREPAGWKVSAAGCRFTEGKPRDRPAECQVED